MMNLHATDDLASWRYEEAMHDGPIPEHRKPVRDMQRLQRILGAVDVLMKQGDQARDRGDWEAAGRLWDEAAAEAAKLHKNGE